jgi:hypothetical protein
MLYRGPQDNIMFVEPAVLVMAHSLKKYPTITVATLEQKKKGRRRRKRRKGEREEGQRKRAV